VLHPVELDQQPVLDEREIERETPYVSAVVITPLVLVRQIEGGEVAGDGDFAF
jgi:hypothetical protein